MPTIHDFQALLPEEAETLVAMMQRIVPHSEAVLRDTVWLTALAYEAQLVSQVNLRQTVRATLQEMNRRARQQHAPSFAEASQDMQDALLHDMEDTAFFQSLIHATVTDFYNRHVVWEAIGYPGVAQRDGAGYIHKGFDRLSEQ